MSSFEKHSRSNSTTHGYTGESDNNPSANMIYITEDISKYIRENYKKKINSPAFQNLQELFGIFHDQLRINFDLRNELLYYKKKPAYNFKHLRKQKKLVDDFINKFKEKRDKSATNLYNISKILEKDIFLLKEMNEYSRICQHLKSENNELKCVINDLQTKFDSINKENTDKLHNYNNNLKTMDAKIFDLQKSIDQILPLVRSLKTRVKEKEQGRSIIKDQLNEKKTQMEKAKEAHEIRQQQRRSEKDQLRTRLGVLIAQKEKLIQNEKPLIRALEEAEEQVRVARDIIKNKITDYEKEKEALLADICSVNEKLDVLRKEESSLKTEMNNLTQGIELEKLRHDRVGNESNNIFQYIKDIEDKLKQMLLNTNTPEDELRFTESVILSVQDQIQTRKDQIEKLRIETNKVNSLIRVTEKQNQTLQSDNESIASQLTKTKKEVEPCRVSYNRSSDHYKVMRQTIDAFARLRNELKIADSLDYQTVAHRAIDIVSNSLENHLDPDDIPVKVSSRTVSADIEAIAQRISSIEAKLNNC